MNPLMIMGTVYTCVYMRHDLIQLPQLIQYTWDKNGPVEYKTISLEIA